MKLVLAYCIVFAFAGFMCGMFWAFAGWLGVLFFIVAALMAVSVPWAVWTIASHHS